MKLRPEQYHVRGNLGAKQVSNNLSARREGVTQGKVQDPTTEQWEGKGREIGNTHINIKRMANSKNGSTTENHSSATTALLIVMD